jgi:hypothetical protein
MLPQLHFHSTHHTTTTLIHYHSLIFHYYYSRPKAKPKCHSNKMATIYQLIINARGHPPVLPSYRYKKVEALPFVQFQSRTFTSTFNIITLFNVIVFIMMSFVNSFQQFRRRTSLDTGFQVLGTRHVSNDYSHMH